MQTDWLIVGGGVAGLVLATKLAQHGKKFMILEQSEPALGGGAGLLLAPNATRILQQLGLCDAAIAKGRLTKHWSIRGQSGGLLRELAIPLDGPLALSIHRGELVALLRSNLPRDSMRTGSKVLGVRQDLHGLRVQLAEGESVACQALIGADGIRSTVRQYLFGAQPLRFRGYIGWRGIAPFVPPAYDGGTLSESWGAGGRFGIAPVDGGRTYWYASANQAEDWLDIPFTRKDFLRERFQHWHNPVMELIEATPDEQILVSRIYDGPKLRRWSDQQVVLIGDAAHAMTPNLGQGACLAMEDAWVLGEMIARFPEAIVAFREYERRRMRRALRIQRQSRAMGWIVQAERPWSVAVRACFTSLIPEVFVRAGMRSIFSGKLL